MIITSKRHGSNNEFTNLLARAHSAIIQKNLNNPIYFLDRDAKKFEIDLFNALKDSATNSPFHDKIELISGHKFPDIVIDNVYGVEVKTSKSDWKSLGNSVLETTRVDSVKDIYLYFAKLSNPIEFKYRPYQECLYDVAVTHSPRYLIDMNLEIGKTIFDKIKLPYNNLIQLDNPVKPFVEYYKSLAKSGEETWWMGSNEETIVSPLLSFLNDLNRNERNIILAETFILFPEVFQSKFHRVATYLVIKYGLTSWNLRDFYSSGGKKTIRFNNYIFNNLPAIYKTFFDLKDYYLKCFEDLKIQDLTYHWNYDVSQIENTSEIWLRMLLAGKNENEKLFLTKIHEIFLNRKHNTF